MIKKENIQDIIPLLPLQEGMLFHYLTETQSNQYHEHFTMEIAGSLDEEIFVQTWELLVRHHEALRVVFKWRGIRQPIQVVLKNKKIVPEMIDLDKVDVPAFKKELFGQLTKQECARRYINEKLGSERLDLEQQPYRIVFCKSQEKSYLHLIYHHILMDGWSLNLLIKGFIDTYSKLKSQAYLPDVCGDGYIQAIKQLSQQKNEEGEKEFWQEYLDGCEIYDPVRPLEITREEKKDSVEVVSLEEEFESKIKRFAQNHGITPAAFYYGMLGILLQRFGNKEDITIGTTISGRSGLLHEYEQAVGLFINTVPLRLKGASCQTPAAYLRQVQEGLFRMMQYQRTPLTDIKSYAGIVAEQPLFKTLVVIENYPMDAIFTGSMKTETGIGACQVEEHTNYELTILVKVHQGIQIDFIYDERAFEPFVIESMAKSLKVLMEDVLRHEEKTLAEVCLMQECDRLVIKKEFNNTKTDYPCTETIVSLFQEQVKKNGNKIAVIYQDQSISYQELDIISDRIAGYISREGINAGQIVGVEATKSIEMIAAVMGILKAGCAYVPIHPEYPKVRKQKILDQTASGIVFTNKELPPEIPSGVKYVDIRNICSDGENTEENITVLPNSLAYLIFTSGSTGNPKGIMIEHKGIVRLVKNTNYVKFLDQDRLLSTCSLEFDVSAFEIFGALLNGIPLCLMHKQDMLSPVLLKKEIEDKQVSMMWMTTPLFNQMVQAEPAIFDTIRYLIIGGDTLVPAYINLLRNYNQNIQIVNGYGPTENTVLSTAQLIECQYERRIPIGKPISNSTAYIVDVYGNLQPIGAVGEICVGMDGVARGYHNDPVLTGQQFIPDILFPGNTMYKTGDIGRFLPDGTIDFFGRNDHQIKVRGFRIELQEIEKALDNCEGISQSVVLCEENHKGEKELVAFLETKEETDEQALRAQLNQLLPPYYMPSKFVFLAHMPYMVSGKLDRKALKRLAADRKEEKQAVIFTGLEKKIADIWKEVLGFEVNDNNKNFFETGGNSLQLIKLSSLLKKELNLDISEVDLFAYSTISSIAGFIESKQTKKPEKTGMDKSADIDSDDEYMIENYNSDKQNEDIAIVGVSCRFPEAMTKEIYWENLKLGKESAKVFTKEELRNSGIKEDVVKSEQYVPVKAILDEYEYFDHGLFGCTEREAELMDPQLRLLHECTFSALEDAGLNSECEEEKIGLYIGASPNFAWLNSIAANQEDSTAKWEAANLNYHSLATPISYRLGLNGPSIMMSTACSSSLAAVHMAYQAVKRGECTAAVAGGVSVALPVKNGYEYQEGMIRSADGHCRAYGQDANGTFTGDGVGLVALMPLSKAVEQRAHIYGVIKGSALNNDGNKKVGFTAPGYHGQVEVIRKALADAAISPESINYIEGHGTGTHLGDKIEIQALQEVFKNRTSTCVLGSVKSNIGHLDAAAGIAGLIKTILMLEHGQIVPSINVEKENEIFSCEDNKLVVGKTLMDWKADGSRRAGVSSFGIGGTNVHMILEENSQKRMVEDDGDRHIILLSGDTKNALKRNIDTLREFIEREEVSVSDLSYTLKNGRKHLKYRLMIEAGSLCELAGQLGKIEKDACKEVSRTRKKVVFLFPGQGSQFTGMGKGLYEENARFRRVADECFTYLKDFHLDILKDYFLGIKEMPVDTKVIQPLLFVFEYALASALSEMGIEPDYMIGHSIGEYTAACIAGVFSLKDAVKLVVYRSRYMQEAQSGQMISVICSSNRARSLTEQVQGIDIAAVNGQEQFVFSGAIEHIHQLRKILDDEQIIYKELQVSHAFHSRMMQGAGNEYIKILKTVDFHAPSHAYLSCVTGLCITDEDACDPQYYIRHLLQTVQFYDGVKPLADQGYEICIEIGPGAGLSNMVRKYFGESKMTTFTTVVAKEADNKALLGRLAGKLWLCGLPVVWNRYDEGRPGSRVPLPEYQFEKKVFAKYSPEIRINQENEKIDQQLYVPVWKSYRLPESVEDGQKVRYLFFAQDNSFSRRIVRCLEEKGRNVTVIYQDSQSIKEWDVNEYRKQLDGCGKNTRILYNWHMKEGAESFRHLTAVGNAIGCINQQGGSELLYMTGKLEKVFDTDQINPDIALIRGPINVIPLEYPQIKICCIDIGEADEHHASLTAEMAEAFPKINNTYLALRQGAFYTRQFQQKEMLLKSCYARMKYKGNYIITGGTGAIGKTVALYLLKKFDANVIVISRSERSTMPYESGEGMLCFMQTDVTNEQELKNTFLKIKTQMPIVDGVFHCAGIADGRLLSALDEKKAHQIMAPKVEGTNNIYRILEEVYGRDGRCLILFSSLTGVTGAVGQCAYTAANAYMDSFAQNAKGAIPVISIDWDTWCNQGMANRERQRYGITLEDMNWTEEESDGRNYCYSMTNDKNGDASIYKIDVSESDVWLFKEHQINGQGILPGTAYINYLFMCACHLYKAGQLEIDHIYFLEPYLERHTGSLYIRIGNGENPEFSIFTLVDGMHREHANGILKVPNAGITARLAQKNCVLYDSKISDGSVKTEGGIRYGKRWQGIKTLKVSEKTVAAQINLPAEYRDEVQKYALHPALMDQAIGIIALALEQTGGMLPFAYQGLRILRTLPDKITSRVSVISENKTESAYECIVSDTSGEPVLEADRYITRKVSQESTKELLPAKAKIVMEQAEDVQLQIRKKGDLQSFYYSVKDTRVLLEPDEVEIRVHAAGLNFKEVLYALGMLELPKQKALAFGLECSGIVTRIGSGVTGFCPGDAVMGMGRNALNKYAISYESGLMHIPCDMEFEQAATIPIAYITAYYALMERGGLKCGDRVLIHAATGGVGMAAVKIAQAADAQIIVTAGSEEKRNYLRNMGLAYVYDSRSSSFAEQIEEQFGSVDIVLNSLTGELKKRSLNLLGKHGRFLELGIQNGLDESDSKKILQDSITYSCISTEKGMPGQNAVVENVEAAIKKGIYQYLPYRTFGIEEISQAFTYLAQVKHIGKVVINYSVASQIETGLTKEQGLAVLERIMNSNFAESKQQFIVSVKNLKDRFGITMYDESYEELISEAAAGLTTVKRKRPDISVDYAPPLSRTEQEICQLIAEYADLDRVGINDNFFDLGITSLDLIQINNIMKKQYEKQITMVHMYSNPTVSMLAGYLTDQEKQNYGDKEINRKQNYERTVHLLRERRGQNGG